ncbi:heavy-metal-associated domain-containing protein [Haloarcula salinisoli]|jgi:copper chaperone CopZ|uniref:Cation transporter n=1 Tax=Haloarcula salinisoli TaxID=2487746 RepID=A0A8J7YQD4_9EURY|nr:cation transporter [Halomicroarcula salinisoli]MBX0288037.1 cation transporter [Halomicroarcula salinisoli]MBX0305423.1 cation transporter [Halomicroarcula salinisoli]
MATTITVEGMTCGHCEQTVEEAVEEVSGVTGAAADRDAEQVTVEGDTDVSSLVEAVEDAGYTAQV